MAAHQSGQALFVKELCDDDIPAYLSMLSETVCAILGIKSRADEAWYLAQRLEKIKDGSTFFVCIFEYATETLIGAVEIRDPSYRSQLYNWINESYWGNGYYQEALSLAVKEYFDQYPQETTITACVDVSNKRSYFALKKFGFIEFGIIKGPKEDQYQLVYSRTQ